MSSTTVCMTDTSVIPFPTLDSTHTQSSNTAVGPLPHIPCRNARSTTPSPSDTSSSDSNASKSTDSIDYALQTRSATYVRYESGSSSSSSTPSEDIHPIIIPRSKRVASQHSLATDSQDVFTPVTPASTPVKPKGDGRSFAGIEGRRPTPLRDTSDEEDTLRPFPVLRQAPFAKFGRLRLEGSTGKHVRHSSDSTVIASRAPTASTASANPPPQTIRKKSGQPVKSSLKSARRPELHVVTDGSFAKSEPVTPTHTKAVKFDSKLEHVKLFLAEQKPLAVSRDGSPTSDTSGDEFPSFIYGDSNHEHQLVKMLTPNMPSSPRKDDNVALQELVFSQDQRAINGTVRVRNIAYEKWLAVRFTLDWWQTTSEVTARYNRPTEDGKFDVFTFTLRLHDIWPRIEEKTIFFALRYAVAGKEYWDNNAGKNYHVKFVVAPPSEPLSAVDNETSLKDLDHKLEDLAKARSTPILITPYRLGRSFSADHQYASFGKPLSARYDFASAHKTQWSRNAPVQPSRHTRTQTLPPGVPGTAGPVAAPWSNIKAHVTEQVVSPPPSRPHFPLSLSSPREAMDDTVTASPRSRTKPSLPDNPSPSRIQDGRERNHHRGCDKMMEGSPNLRRTPPGSPLRFGVTNKDTSAQLPRTRSYPLSGEKPGLMAHTATLSTARPPLSIQIAQAEGGGSAEPTPYAGSQTSSSSSGSCSTPLKSPGPECPKSDTSYKQFLDQFCFYTGADSLLQEPSETLPRSHSASSIECCLLSHSPPQSFASHMRDLPSRSTTPMAVRV